MDFESILYRISESDEAAFGELFGKFFPGMLSYATSFLKDQQLAEEVVEDVFVKFWENRKTAREIRKVPFYLYRAVRYASIDAMERNKKFKSLSFEEIGEAFTFSYLPQANSLINKENCLKISDAISQLPARCRLIFRLVKEEGMKYKEVAQLLDLSEKTVENQMNIAIKKLVDTLKTDFPEFSAYFFPRKN
ncbi:RNA polymerase sigma factor [Niabella drilacis]|uniref:RNA polymerase sigma factor n=1 Tax=Niabella drilacis (strain DSM 25811 / CCM 8410 / CCUG 62505 / LMG 26954 / E90) TaxID=1285928 RepID=UPI0015A2CC39|nr:RNA polymerase sigma-70 factor [Niabella drilacis]